MTAPEPRPVTGVGADVGLSAAIEAEWYNGNLAEDCRDRLLAALRAEPDSERAAGVNEVAALASVIAGVTDLWDEPLDDVRDIPQIVNAVLAAGWHRAEPDSVDDDTAGLRARLAAMPVCTDPDCPIYARHRAKRQTFPPHGPHDFRAAADPAGDERGEGT